MDRQRLSFVELTTRALREAAAEAIRTAREKGTLLAVWKDGQVALITPDEAEASRQKEAM